MSVNDRYSMIYQMLKTAPVYDTLYTLIDFGVAAADPWNEFWILEIKTTIQQTFLFQKGLENFEKHNGWFLHASSQPNTKPYM